MAVFITASFFINSICFYLSPVALFVILFYSYTKRFTYLCHLVLGIGLSLAPIGAYLAVTGSFALLPLLFSFAVVFWVSGFDDGGDCFRYSKLLYSTLSISFVSRVLLLSGFFFAVQSTQLLCSTLPHLFVFLIHLLSNLFRILFLHLLDLQPCWLNLYFNWLLG